MRVAVVGSRGIRDAQHIHGIIDTFHSQTPITRLVSGRAVGPDELAEAWALVRGIPTDIYLPDWKKHGRSAGMIRNAEIVANCDEVLAFWDGKSRGTKNTIDRAYKAGKRVTLVMDTEAASD